MQIDEQIRFIGGPLNRIVRNQMKGQRVSIHEEPVDSIWKQFIYTRRTITVEVMALDSWDHEDVVAAVAGRPLTATRR